MEEEKKIVVDGEVVSEEKFKEIMEDPKVRVKKLEEESNYKTLRKLEEQWQKT